MNFRSLELFCSVAEFRSISQAASEHGLTQSAVSQALHQLEKSLGIQLVDRSRRPLVLTTAGEVYLAGVQKLLRGYQRLEQDVRSLGEKLAGRLSIGAIYSIGSTYMPAAREAFRARHPEVQVRFEYASSETVARLVEEGEVDFGLLSYPRNTRRLRSVGWLQEPMRVICAASHRFAARGEIELRELEGCELVGFDSSLKVRREVDAFLMRQGVNVDVTMEFDNIDSMIRAVEANDGLTILPEATVRKECEGGSLRVITCKQMRLSRPLGIIVRRAGTLTRAADDFVAMLLGGAAVNAPPASRKSPETSPGARRASEPEPVVGGLDPAGQPQVEPVPMAASSSGLPPPAPAGQADRLRASRLA